MELSRRGLLGGLLALVAAPAIVRVESLMVLPAPQKLLVPTPVFIEQAPLVFMQKKNNLLTIDMITREAVSLFRNSNAFIRSLDMKYDEQFALDGARIGDSLRIHMPKDYYREALEQAAIKPKSSFLEWSRSIAA